MATRTKTVRPARVPLAIKRVAQTNDFDCAFACVAMIVRRRFKEVRQLAVDQYGLPPYGPYLWMDEALIVKLLAHWSFTATGYVTYTDFASVPDLAICMVGDPRDELIGRHVVFVRERDDWGQPLYERIFDPGYWLPPSKHVRTDLQAFRFTYFIGVTPSANADSTGKHSP
jgi:hypothetical protein